MDAKHFSRRDLLGTATFAGAAAVAGTWMTQVRSARAEEEAKAPPSTALQTGTLEPLPYSELEGFLSKEQLNIHHTKHYGGALKGLLGIEARLYGAENVSDVATRRELGKAQSEKANSVLLHELYFTGMCPSKQAPPADLLSALTKRFGTVDRWRADLEACALSANGWAMLAVHPLNGRLYHVLSDAHDVGPLWLGRPLLLIDMYEHAFYVDYKNDKASYVKAWFSHIDWAEAERRYQASR